MMALWTQKDMLMCFEIKMNTHPHTHTPTNPFHSTLPRVAAPANLSLFLSLRKDHRNIGMLLLETNAMAYSIMHILKIRVCAVSRAHPMQTYYAM